MRDYEVKVDGDESYATYKTPDVYLEVLQTDDTSEQQIQDHIDKVLIENVAETKLNGGLARDDVYVGGEVVRQDHSLGTPEGQAILDELKNEFPDLDIVDFESDKYNCFGKFDGYREPYKNASISFYDPNAELTDSINSHFNLPSSVPHFAFYGLKFDLVTKDIGIKLVFDKYEDTLPELPVSISPILPTYYSVNYSKEGLLGDWVSVFIPATPKRILDFCDLHGIKYPLPPTTHTECDLVITWGFVFNRHNLEYGPLKGYARYNLNDETATPL